LILVFAQIVQNLSSAVSSQHFTQGTVVWLFNGSHLIQVNRRWQIFQEVYVGWIDLDRKFFTFEALEDIFINELLDYQRVKDFVRIFLWRIFFFTTDVAFLANGALARLNIHI